MTAVSINTDRPDGAGDATSNLGAWLRVLGNGWRVFTRNRLAVVSLIFLVSVCILSLAAPLLAPFDPHTQDLSRTLMAPGGPHLMGTDQFGRDIFSRLLHGGKITLLIAVMVGVLIAPVGLVVGAAAGFFGGIADTVLMRLTDVFMSFPGLVLAIAFVTALGPGLENAILAIALTAWPPIARLARAEAALARRADYMNAGRLSGASAARLLFVFVMPICLPSVLLRVTLNMSIVVITAAGLGFLGLGAQPPSPEWGAMLATGRDYMLTAWWLPTFPGLFIALLGVAFSLVGDGLRDVLDPRS